MSNIGTASRIYDQSRALNFCKMTFSKEYYGKVISQYKKIIGSTVAGTLVLIVVILVVLLTSLGNQHAFSNHSYGRYDDGQIRYVRGGTHYIDMEDLGLNPSEYRQGDEFTLLFDSDGNISEVILPEQREKESMIFVIEMMAGPPVFIIIAIIWVIVARKIFSKSEFGRYFRWWHTTIGAYGPGLCNNCGRRCSTPEQCVYSSNTVK